jgi:O-antigen ligase
MPLGQFIEGEKPLVTTLSSRLRLERGLRISLFVALCALLMFGPLAMGIVDDWSTAVFEIGAAAVLLIWTIWQLAAVEVQIRWSPLFAPMLVFLGIVLLQIAFHRTAYLYDSLSELWLYVAYGILTFVAVQLIRADDSIVVRFGDAMAVYGSVYAVFAILQGFTSEGKIYWFIKQAGSVYGGYVNHNHYAGLMELLFPIVLVPAFNGSVRGAKRGLLLFAAMLMVASVFLCQSRGGMFAITVEMLILAIFWMREFAPRKSAAVFALLFCLVTASFLAWIAPQQVGSRITNTHDPARWLIHRDSIRMFAAHPFLGSGFGTFATAFPRYRVFYDGFVVNNAHDDYLELLLETGLAGFGVGVWFLVVLYREGLRNLRKARLSATAALCIAALVGCTGLLAHSFLDFNLHIPANAALFYVLCAVATAPLVRKSRNMANGKSS